LKHWQSVKQLHVQRRLSDGSQVLVGRLAQNAHTVYFQYDADYLADHPSLSPFTLPFASALSPAPKTPHYGLHGVFADSLPDGWGLLLMDRVFRQHGIDPQQLTVLDRLAYVGAHGMGALTYAPVAALLDTTVATATDITALGQHAVQVFDGQTQDVLAALAQAGGSGGARPKALIYRDTQQPQHAATLPLAGLQPWLVKFTSQHLPLGHDEGLCEAAYLTMAAAAGIEVPTWQLFESPRQAWLGLARFDCNPAVWNGRYHMHTLCGLLDADFRQPSLDYEYLIKASQVLCNNPAVGRRQFVRALFNLFAANQDDHTKNWSFLMDDAGQWQPAPFYDVTFSPNPHQEHSTAFMGYGKQPPLKVIQKLATQANFAHWHEAKAVIAQIVEALSQWSTLAKELAISAANRQRITAQLNALYQQNKGLLG
jgi:serine/threonine-protein kinase HipA